MAFFDTTWYVHAGDGSTTGYYAVPLRAASTAYAVGQIVRQFTAPAVGSERAFVCIIAGTSSSATDATWVLTRGARTTDGTVTWQECTGAAGLNGDLTNAPAYSAVGNQAITLGQTIKNNAATYYFICSVAGTTGNTEPAWNLTAGATTTSGTATWTCLGPVGNFATWAAPHARLANAFVSTWGVNGHDFYVADNSAETSSAAISLQIGVNGFASRMMSVDHTASLPAGAAGLKPGATFTSSLAANNAILISNSNSVNAYWYGFNFIGSGVAAQPVTIVASSLEQVRFDNCSFQITGGSSTSIIGFGGGTSFIDLNACTFGLTSAAQIVQVGSCAMTWRNTPDPCFMSGLIGGVTFVLPTTAIRAGRRGRQPSGRGR